MFSRRTAAKVVATLGGAALLGAALAGCSTSGGSGGASTISLLAGGNDPASTKFANDLATAFHKANPDITVKVETRPAGTDGDNLIKTRLSTGEMNDVFLYNSGSLFQALHPDTQLAPLTDESWTKDLTDDFKKTVSTDKGLYGAPTGTTFDGAARYAAWKIERHTGVPVALTPWREKHPVLAAPGVLWRVWRARR